MNRTTPPRVITLLALSTSLAVSCGKKEIVEPPPGPVATSITITPANPGIDAINGAVQLSAQVLDQNRNALSGLTISWSSNAAAIARVDGTGLVTGLALGAATITATAGAITNTIIVTITQVPALLSKVGGDGQNSSIGALLASALVVQVNDRLGTSVGAGHSVTFAATIGGGSVSATSGTTDANGRTSTTWTLGTSSGSQEVTASLTGNAAVKTIFTASASAAAADSIFIVQGSGQNGVVNAPLTDSLVVRAVDAFGNPVPGTPVAFTVTGGGGAVSPANVNTDPSGDAAASFTLGPVAGQHTVQAVSGGLKGSPLTFLANGTTLTLNTITPNPMIEGGSATLTGTGFDGTPGNNSVTIGGTAAIVTAASPTSLTVTVPARDCKPAADLNVVVSVGGGSTPPVPHRVHPASTLNMNTGDHLIITNPNNFCLQLLPSGSGATYLIGAGATDDVDASVAVSLVAEAGAASAPGLPGPVIDPGPAFAPRTNGFTAVSLTETSTDAHLRILDWERRNLDPARNPGLWNHLRTPYAVSAAASQMVPNVGDTIDFRVPDITAPNFCSSFSQVTTKVRAVGTYGIIVEDTTNASASTDTLTQVDFDHFAATFDTLIYPVDTTYFGSPTDLDMNQRVIMVFTRQVNTFGNIAGFVVSTDLLPATGCASSDFGEIFYGYVPVTGGPTRQDILANALPLIAHEVTHNIQQSRRAAASSQFMASWEAEGQADLAKEVVGHAALGNAPRNDYQNSVVLAALPTEGGFGWYQQRFTRLALYFGWAGNTNRVAGDTPNECSLLGHSGPSVPCQSSYFYGSGWAFHRYVSDRFGPGYPGGEAGLQRDWIGGTQKSLAGVGSLLGVNVDTLFAQWAAMLYADGRAIANLPAELQMTSWNMAQIYSQYHSSLSLQPVNRGFVAFADARDVRKGSTAYTLVSSGGAHGAVAIRLRDQSDGILNGADKPQLWILRTN